MVFYQPDEKHLELTTSGFRNILLTIAKTQFSHGSNDVTQAPVQNGQEKYRVTSLIFLIVRITAFEPFTRNGKHSHVPTVKN